MSNPGRLSDLMVPVGYVAPRTIAPLLSAAANEETASSIVDMFGGDRHYKPTAPIMLVGPDGRTPIILITEGEVEAAELQDMALEAIGNQEERISSFGRGLNFDELRERDGYVRREDAGNAIKDAIAARIAHHLQNPVTDPFRQPRYAERPPQYMLGAIPQKEAE